MKDANYEAKIVRHYGEWNGEGKTLDNIIAVFEKAVGYLDHEIVECDDGRYYWIYATVDVDEISQDEAAERTDWFEAEDEYHLCTTEKDVRALKPKKE